MEILELDEVSPERLQRLMDRNTEVIEDVEQQVRSVLESIRNDGDEALIRFTRQFDGNELRPEQLAVTSEEIEQAYREVDEELQEALRHLSRNSRRFHEHQRPESWRTEIEPGVEIGEKTEPVETAGLYVPGGKAVYPSVAVHLAVPAHTAGVERSVVCTPPGPEGEVDPAVIMAADMNGVTEIYRVGGAQAVASLAYGTETIESVDVIAGPGGPYVTAAKFLVGRDVGVDVPAGPSEGMVLANAEADPSLVALDVLNEAEHGPDSAGVLVTPSHELARDVEAEWEEHLSRLPPRRRQFVRDNESRGHSAILIAKSLAASVSLVNEYAPEHLVLHVEEPEEVLDSIRHAGTVCMGKYNPISAGNFFAGPNAILPTGGAARWSGSLNTRSFLKTTTIENLDREGLEGGLSTVRTLAEYEGFPAHARSIEERFRHE